MNPVRQLLKVKGEHVWTISKESTVLDSLELMAEKRIGSLVVIKDGQVIGILPSVIMLDRLALRAETRRKPYVV